MSDSEWSEIFSSNLKSAIIDRGFSQRELAYEADLSKGTISDLVNGNKMPSVRSLINIAYVLDISVDELVNVDEKIF